MKSLQTEFSHAVAAFNAGNSADVKRICLKILKRDKNHSDAAHLLALVYKQLNDFPQSKKYYQQSLKSNPNQAVVLSNYANLLAQHEQFDDALSYFAKSVRADPRHLDAWYNHALLLNRLERFEEALDTINQALALNPEEPKFYNALGNALQGLEEFENSIKAFDKAIALATATSREGLLAAMNKAQTFRNMHKPDVATAALQSLIARNIQAPEILFIKACAHYDAGQYSQAEQDLLHAIDQNPLYIAAHEALNKLYWEQSEDEKFLHSYQAAVANNPNDLSLTHSYASQLILSQRFDQAQQLLLKALESAGKDAGINHALSVLSKRMNDQDAAEKYLDRALKLQPDVTRFRIDKASILIQQAHYKAAFSHLDRAGKLSPLNQEVWAYKGLCWRLLGDEKAEWLNNYDTLINVSELTTPDGYDNLEHFMQSLETALEQHHRTNRQPLDQSVQSGTQTVGKLLTAPEKIIQDYRKVLTHSVNQYMNSLPDDPTHPFLNRNTRQLIHTGSWSVRLNSGGFHSNHMHPRGWLSNCTYISLPKEISPNDPDKAGWIKFGETSLGLGDREQIGKIVCPQRGMRVLFPSFMWHGTVPFESADYRMTIPSDISPKPKRRA